MAKSATSPVVSGTSTQAESELRTSLHRQIDSLSFEAMQALQPAIRSVRLLDIRPAPLRFDRGIAHIMLTPIIEPS